MSEYFWFHRKIFANYKTTNLEILKVMNNSENESYIFCGMLVKLIRKVNDRLMSFFTALENLSNFSVNIHLKIVMHKRILVQKLNDQKLFYTKLGTEAQGHLLKYSSQKKVKSAATREEFFCCNLWPGDTLVMFPTIPKS